MKKKLLFVIGTHGDEPIGSNLLDRLSQKQDLPVIYDSIIGNPRAVKKNKRFTEVDLNRAAPGDLSSSVYEVKRAAELVEMFKKFDYIVDFHETKANDRIIIIIPRLRRESLALAITFDDIKEILIWPPYSPDVTTGPLVQYARFGIEVECGTKTSFQKTLLKLEKIITNFLETGIKEVENNLGLPISKIKEKKFYLVYGRIEPDKFSESELQDFKEISTSKETFTPLLFGKHQGLKGYKMQLLDISEVYNMALKSQSLLFS